MVSIKVTTVTRKESAAKFVKAIQGQSYLNFDVQLCPIGGMLNVNVVTLETDDEQAAKGMLNLLMFDAIQNS